MTQCKRMMWILLLLASLINLLVIFLQFSTLVFVIGMIGTSCLLLYSVLWPSNKHRIIRLQLFNKKERKYVTFGEIYGQMSFYLAHATGFYAWHDYIGFEEIAENGRVATMMKAWWADKVNHVYHAVWFVKQLSSWCKRVIASDPWRPQRVVENTIKQLLWNEYAVFCKKL